MSVRKQVSMLIIFLLLISATLVIKGCGQPAAKDQGCPSGSFLANSTDILTAPDDQNLAYAYPFYGGSVLYTPVLFKVTDINEVPRNNICLILYTADSNAALGPYWYTDATYSALVTGVGPFQTRAVLTDEMGVATVFWSTAWLPASEPRVLTSPTGTEYTAGETVTGTSFIKVSSGTKEEEFNVNWSVAGQPADVP